MLLHDRGLIGLAAMARSRSSSESRTNSAFWGECSLNISESFFSSIGEGVRAAIVQRERGDEFFLLLGMHFMEKRAEKVEPRGAHVLYAFLSSQGYNQLSATVCH
jgi:hypothetical protein